MNTVYRVQSLKPALLCNYYNFCFFAQIFITRLIFLESANYPVVSAACVIFAELTLRKAMQICFKKEVGKWSTNRN